MGEKTKQKETDKRRKFSFDITVENYEYIQNYSKNAGKPIGSSINSLIALLLKMPTQMRDELATFCELRMEQLALDYRKVGEFEQLTVQELNDSYSEFYELLTSSKQLYPSYTKEYTRIELADSYILFPSDWNVVFIHNNNLTVVNERKAYRAIVVELYISTSRIYHFLFFTCNPTKHEFTDDQIKLLYKSIDEKCVFARDHLNKALQYPVMSPNDPDYIKKIEEYNKAPHVTIRHIMRTDDPDYDKNAKQPYDCLIYANQK